MKEKKKNKKQNNGWIQFGIGSVMMLFGIYQMYEAKIIGNPLGGGVLLGQGCVFFL